MLKRFLTFVLLPILSGASQLNAYYPSDRSAALETIAFGSCNRGDLPQPLWPIIAQNDPDLFIWGGDNVYGDWHPNLGTNKPVPDFDRSYIAQQYAYQYQREDYAHFRETTPILGTWDDHDYGLNDSNRHFPLKSITRDLALSFMEVPITDVRWQREGIYGSYRFGPEGQETLVVLLDNRYFKTKRDAEAPGILGDVQRAWLVRTLKESEADLHVIVSGTQVLPIESRFERWANYPRSREWLIDLIADPDMPLTILLSGDRHFHEISVLKHSEINHDLVEMTSSGMTHPWTSFKGESNPLRHGEVYNQIAYGLVQIDWSNPEPIVTLQIRDTEDHIRNEITVSKVPSP